MENPDCEPKAGHRKRLGDHGVSELRYNSVLLAKPSDCFVARLLHCVTGCSRGKFTSFDQASSVLKRPIHRCRIFKRQPEHVLSWCGLKLEVYCTERHKLSETLLKAVMGPRSARRYHFEAQ